MKSNTSVVARQYRIQQWATQIQECNKRPAGVSIKCWCDEHNVTVANYYYRLREVRKACLENLPTESNTRQLVPVPTELVSTSNTTVNSFLEVVVNDICIRVTEATSPELLKMVLQVATNVK